MAQAEGCPIESNIKSTAGRNNEDAMSISDHFSDSNDAEFDDEDGDDIMGGNGGWGSVHSSDDGQQVPQRNNVDYGVKVLSANEENPFEEGNDAVKVIINGGRPIFGQNDPKQKCWMCDVCHGINNLLETMKKYNYKCCLCSTSYNTNAAIIFSNEWDGINPDNDKEEEIYTVWNCPFCTLKNGINWTNCDGCDVKKPSKCEVSYSYIKPKRINEKYNYINNAVQNNNIYEKDNINNIKKNDDKKKKRVVRKPRIGNIGIARNIDEYPPKSGLNDKLEDRLVSIFGKPFRNKLLKKKNKNKWSVDCSIYDGQIQYTSQYIPSKKFITEEIVGRGFAVNARTGWIALMSSLHIWVFSPADSSSYVLVAQYTFGDEQKLDGVDASNSRIRFVGNNGIFVWSFARSRIYSFKLYSSSLILVDVIRDKYFKDSQTMDIAVCNDLLILLFDRWCGVYKLYPKFKWFHAVAFATKTVNCFSLEIVDYDGDNESESNRNYLFINTEDQLIGIHPTNPTFDFLHIASDTKHSLCKYCISKYYGIFYLSNDSLSLYQSPHLNRHNNLKLFDVKKVNNEINKFKNINYDEMFGISGRLLVIAQNKNNEYFIHQFINENELDLVKTEIKNMKQIPGTNSFNKIINIYKMLYGNHLIDQLIQSQQKQFQTDDDDQKEGLM